MSVNLNAYSATEDARAGQKRFTDFCANSAVGVQMIEHSGNDNAAGFHQDVTDWIKTIPGSSMQPMGNVLDQVQNPLPITMQGTAQGRMQQTTPASHKANQFANRFGPGGAG